MIDNRPALDDLVEAVSTAGGSLDDEGRRIALATYRLLAAGAPVSDAHIASDTGVDVDAVARRFGEWPGVFRNHNGAIIGFWGLALEPLDPRYELRDTGGGLLGYAWCAWDTLFLPGLLNRTVEVSATDGLTGQAVSLRVSPDRVERTDPAEAVVTFLAPDGPWDADVLGAFCHKVLFFSDPHNAEQWMTAHPDRLFTLSAAEALEVGRRWIDSRYGDALRS